jgi:hypothetical protein
MHVLPLLRVIQGLQALDDFRSAPFLYTVRQIKAPSLAYTAQ